MQTPSFRLLRRVIAYLIGAFLIGWGLCCLGYEGLFPARMMPVLSSFAQDGISPHRMSFTAGWCRS